MLNYNLLKDVQAGFNKKAFVQMPGKSAQDMGAMPPDAAAGAVDPATGMPMDPAAAGMPMDPAAGAMPPPGLDAAMAGMAGGGAMPPADPAAAMGGATITCTLDDLAKFMQKVLAIKNSGGIEQPQNNDMAEIRQALTQIAAQMGQGAQIA